MKTLIPILFNIRSVYNVGAILRSCDGFGIREVYCAGWTPNPKKGLAHEQLNLTKRLHKTALGAETKVEMKYITELRDAIRELRSRGFKIYALEQDSESCNLVDLELGTDEKIALILGEERYGLGKEILAGCDKIVEIPMLGSKESFNVSVAAAIAFYEMRRKDLSLLRD